MIDETNNDLTQCLLLCCLPFQGTQSSLKVNCTYELQNLINWDVLTQHNIILDVTGLKHMDFNYISKQANQELELELLKTDPSGSPVSAKGLLNAVFSLNSNKHSKGSSFIAKQNHRNMNYLSCTDEPPLNNRKGVTTSSREPIQPYVAIGTNEQDFHKQCLVPRTKIFKVANSKRNEKGTTSCDISSDSEYGLL